MKLTARRHWVLQYLKDNGVTGTTTYFEDGLTFIAAYAKTFDLDMVNIKKVQRSLTGLVYQLELKGLIKSNHGTNVGHSSVAFDGPPTHCNEYELTGRGEDYLREQ